MARLGLGGENEAEGDGGDRCFILYLRQGNVGYTNCCKFVVILSSSLLAVKSMLVGDVNVIRARLGDDKCRYL